MDDREKYWIQELNSLEPYGYNLTKGGVVLYGENNPFFGKHHTQETINIIIEKNTGRKANEQERIMRSEINSGVRNPFFGKKHSEETLINKIIQTKMEILKMYLY